MESKTFSVNFNFSNTLVDSLTYITTDTSSKYGVVSNANNTAIPPASDFQTVLTHVNVALYLLICLFGLIGNALVIFVILMYSEMKKVTNMYILNLAISDILFLTMLPITVTTVIVKHWVFGLFMCKMYFVLCAINVFGGAFNLTVMSADRYLAVCHPIKSVKYRTPRVALCLCVCVWLLSFLVMIPLILYTTTIKHHTLEGKFSCNMEWPDQIIPTGTAFIWYSFMLGFLIPVIFISIFYVLIIFRLRHFGLVKKSKEHQRSRGRATRLIFTVVTVYVVCWLPYWCIQVHSTFSSITSKDTSRVLLMNGLTVLSYSNSMLNPILYAFLSDNFRQSFAKAFQCFSSRNVRSPRDTMVILPSSSHTLIKSGPERAASLGKIELSVMENCSATLQVPSTDKIYSKANECEDGFLKPN